MLKIFKEADKSLSLFVDFQYMDYREEELRYKNSYQGSYYNQNNYYNNNNYYQGGYQNY